MGLAETADLAIRINLSGNARAGIRKLKGDLGGLTGSVGRVGKGFGQIGTGMARAGLLVGGAAITGIAAATKAAIEWEDAFTGVKKTVDATATTSLADIEAGLRKLATSMPVTAADLALIAENAGAMGIKADDIIHFTDTVAKLGATTNVTVDDASMALGQMVNVIGLTGAEFDNFAASLVALGNAGNSTESAILEIARRAGGMANLFGIAKEEVLGWSAAAANIGMNEELAGTSLQRMMAAVIDDFKTGSEMLQGVMGVSGKTLQTMFKEDAGGALESLIGAIAKMPKDDRFAAVTELFGKGTGLQRLVLGLADSFDKNLVPSLELSRKAWDEQIAMEAEFEKRNATVKSAIIRLTNSAKDLAITFGEGIAPAIGRAADKLSVFLNDDGNRSQIKELGAGLGEAIEGIDWAKVLDGAKTFGGVLKTALDFVLEIAKAVNLLPTEIKAAGAGFLALNKLSGGLLASGVGNVVGGLAGAGVSGMASRLPGIGKLFAQPVFVTNWPLGGLGGGAGVGGAAAGGMGLLSKVFLVGEAIGLALLVKDVADQVGAGAKAQTEAIHDTLTTSLSQPQTFADLQTKLAGIDQGLDRMPKDPIGKAIFQDSINELQAMRAEVVAEMVGLNTTTDRETREIEANKDAIEATRIRLATELGNVRTTTSTGMFNLRQSEINGTAQIVAAIRGIRPVVNVSVSGNLVTRVTSGGVVRRTVNPNYLRAGIT